jgi:hypothetical protein
MTNGSRSGGAIPETILQIARFWRADLYEFLRAMLSVKKN